MPDETGAVLGTEGSQRIDQRERERQRQRETDRERARELSVVSSRRYVASKTIHLSIGDDGPHRRARRASRGEKIN